VAALVGGPPRATEGGVVSPQGLEADGGGGAKKKKGESSSPKKSSTAHSFVVVGGCGGRPRGLLGASCSFFRLTPSCGGGGGPAQKTRVSYWKGPQVGGAVLLGKSVGKQEELKTAERWVGRKKGEGRTRKNGVGVFRRGNCPGCEKRAGGALKPVLGEKGGGSPV